MRHFPNQFSRNDEYEGFKPFGKPGWPGGESAEVVDAIFKKLEQEFKMKLIQRQDGDFVFFDAPRESILWLVKFERKEHAARVARFLYNKGLIHAQV